MQKKGSRNSEKPITKSPWSIQIVISKNHFPLKELGLLGEVPDTCFGTQNVNTEQEVSFQGRKQVNYQYYQGHIKKEPTWRVAQWLPKMEKLT